MQLFLHRDHARRELEEEMQLHRDLRAQSMERDGMSPADAATSARRRFGHIPSLAERSQEFWGFQRGDELWSNVRYAGRRLTKRPWYAASVVLVMGLGIGATSAMFSAVDAVMLRALPFREPHRLVELENVEVPFESSLRDPKNAQATLDLPTVAALPDLFSSVAAFAVGRLNLRDTERPVRLRVGVVTESFFRTLGVDAAEGRTFVPDEGIPGATPVVILSDALLHRQFGGREVLGQAILLDDQPYRVVGVMPRNFSFPEESDLWIPMSVPNTTATFAAFRGYIPSRVIARLAPGAVIAVANQQILNRWEQSMSSSESPVGLEPRKRMLARLRAGGAVRPLQVSLSGSRAKALLILLGATALLLLIACANVTSLLVSDAATRTREISLRTALGASRARIFRQVLTESAVLALGGVVAGLLLAPVVLRALHALMPAGLAGVAAPRMDVRVLAFASSLGLLCGIGFGLWPARAATLTDSAELLKGGGNQRATHRSRVRGSRILITVELALTLMLLVGSGLLLRTFAHLMRLERGMETSQVASLELSFASSVTPAIRLARIEAILDRVRRSPGIESAAAVNDLPLGGSAGTMVVLTSATSGSAQPIRRGARFLQVSDGYFNTLGIPMRAGRDFTPRDDSLAPLSVVINEALARQWFPGVNPIGLQLSAMGLKKPYTVVGVVADVREQGLDMEAAAQLYQPVYRFAPRSFALVARGRATSEVLLATLQNAVRTVDPAQAVDRARMMDDVVRESVASRRTNAQLISLFAALALVLAALGVYSVVAHGVAQRGREFGIRTALGATAVDLLVMVYREILLMVTMGIAIGLAGAWAGTKVVKAMVYGVTVHDPATFAVGPLALAVVALTAAVVPLRRVFRVNPADVIRSD